MARKLTLTLEDDALGFDPGSAKHGRHVAATDLDGATVNVDVKDGQIASTHGERDGQPVETFIISGVWDQDAGGAGAQQGLMASRVTCYLCACSGGSCTCRPYPCPGGGG